MRISPYEDGPFEYDEDPFREKIAPPTDDEMLQEIGEKNLHIIRQVAAGMNLGNVEVTATFDNRVEIKEFTIRGLLLPISPRGGERGERRRRRSGFVKLLDQLKQG